MTELNTPASDTAAPPPPTFDSGHQGLRSAASEYAKQRDEDESPPVEVKIEGDGELSPQEAAKGYGKWKAEREADRKALDDALGLNAEESGEDDSFPSAKKLDEAATEFESATQKIEAAREEMERLRDEIRHQLTESTETKAQLHGAVADAAQLFQQEWAKIYPDIQTAGDLAALRVKDPARAAQAEEDLKRVNMELSAPHLGPCGAGSSSRFRRNLSR